MKPIIIGMSGVMGSGKTVSANYLQEVYKFKKVSFAASLKEKAKLFFPFSEFDFTAGKQKKYKSYDWTVREFLIHLGSFARFHDSDYWVKESGIDNAVGRIVIDDVRFPNEVDYLKKLGAKLIRLKRYEKLNIYGKGLDDPSETSLNDYKDFDYIVEDCVNTTLPSLYKQLDNAMLQFGIK